MTNIRTKIRAIIGDNSTNEKDVFTYGSSSIFTLSESNVITPTTVSRNGTDIGDSFWSYDSTTNKIRVLIAITSGDTIEIDYTYYPNYSDNELNGYIQGALVHLGINNYFNFRYDSTSIAIYPTPTDSEENLIAMIASILINPDNRSYKLPDISISAPNDLPTNVKISRVIGLYKRSGGTGVFTLVN